MTTRKAILTQAGSYTCKWHVTFLDWVTDEMFEGEDDLEVVLEVVTDDYEKLVLESDWQGHPAGTIIGTLGKAIYKHESQSGDDLMLD